jgi:hypothetical protein
MVVKLLRIHPDNVRLMLSPAVAELRRLGLIQVEDRRVQLKTLHEAEQKLFAQIDKWSKLKEEDLDLDLVPSEEMGLKMLRSMNLKQAPAKQLLNGISALLGECFAIVQCQTYEDQLVVAKALGLIFEAYGADAVFTTYTLEMLKEASPHLGCATPRMTYAELIGLDEETGIPLQRGTNPIEGDVIVVLGADALGVEEMHKLIEAAPVTGRLYLLGCPSDLPSLSIGQPFADLLDCKQFKAFHSRFWGISNSAKHEAQEAIWSDSMTPNLEVFDPTQPLSWLECSQDQLPNVIPELLQEISAALDIDPLADIRVVAPSTSHASVKIIQDALSKHFCGDTKPEQFQGRLYQKGTPVVVRQPLDSSSCPAFSVYWPTDISPSQMKLRSVTGAEATVQVEDRIDVFDALVMTPKFIRGRRYELVVLIALAEQVDSINRELMSSLLNSATRSLIVVGEIQAMAEGFAIRPSSRTRSKLLDWVSEK